MSSTLSDLETLGADTSFGSAVLHYSDLLFSICHEKKPGYRHYVIIEFDVHFVENGREWMETFCHLLSSHQPMIDMVAPYLGQAAPDWHWFQSAALRFPKVMQSFFPVVALSERAILADGLGRLDEARVKPRWDAPIFCEAFLPSVLGELSHVLLDLNQALPGSYAATTFLTHLPSPFKLPPIGATGRLLHPIKTMADAPLPPDAQAIIRETEPGGGVRPTAEAAFAAATILVESDAAERGMRAMLRSRVGDNSGSGVRETS